MAGTFTLQNNPQFLNARTGIYTAWDLRRFTDSDAPGPGVNGYEDFRVKQRGAGANLSADIGNTALMQAWVRGTTRDGMGLYRIDNIDTTAPTANTFIGTAGQINTGTIFTTGDPTNPRIDQVFLRILDQQHDGGGSNLAQIQVVDGTATGGATLDNRTGVGATPANSILLADVLIPATVTSVQTANIRDRRQFPLVGTVPPILTAVDMVTFQPHPQLLVAQQPCQSTGSFDQHQTAALMYLPRRIVSATRVRWRYGQGGTANAGNYVIAIYDSSGRLITNATTGVVAYTGALNTLQTRSDTITAQTFEPGWYYVFIGNGAGTGAASVFTNGVFLNCSPGQQGAPSVNLALRLTSGGTVPPTTLLGFTDVSTIAATTVIATVPIVSLSVG